MVVLYTNGKLINNLPGAYLQFGQVYLFATMTPYGKVGIPVQVLFYIGAALLTWFILRYTLIGRGVYALGGNRESAERIGYDSVKINLFIFTYMGFLTGIAGATHISIIQQVDPNSFIGLEMQVIAIVVIGGANVMGGEGSILGTILGLLLMSVLNNGLILMHVSSFWQEVVSGIVILLVVSVDAIQRKRKEKELVKVDLE